MEKKEALEIIKKFVEGNLPIQQFKDICKSDSSIRVFIKDYKDMNIGEKFDYDILKMIDNCNWNNSDQQFKIQIVFADFLVHENIKNFVRTKSYFEKACLYADIVPDWLSDDAMEYVDENIIDKVPNDLSDKEKQKWIKKQIKETFKYEKRPPEFAQSGIWPQDEEGNFLVFRKQKEKGDLVTYIFVNPKTKQEIECEEIF